MASKEVKLTETDIGIIRAGMAYRAKYRNEQHRKRGIRIHIRYLCVHPMNRGGIYPQAERVKHLGCDTQVGI